MAITDLWEFRYKPEEFSDMILADSIKPKLKKALVEHPNLLLSGIHGCGKGTFVDIFIKFTGCEVLRINASDETGVDVIRDKVKSFAVSLGYSDTLKLVYLNEADFLSSNAQAMLRDLIEQTHDICRFILAVNYHDKIIPELKSRCQFIQFPDPPIKDIAKKCIDILKQEGVKYNTKDVITLVKKVYPDIRHTINTLKENVHDGKLSNEMLITSTDDIYKEVLSAMYTKDPSKVRKSLRSNPIDYTRLFEYLYTRLMGDEDVFKNDPVSMMHIAEGSYRNDVVAIKEINFMNSYFKMLKDGAV